MSAVLLILSLVLQNYSNVTLRPSFLLAVQASGSRYCKFPSVCQIYGLPASQQFGIT